MEILSDTLIPMRGSYEFLKKHEKSKTHWRYIGEKKTKEYYDDEKKILKKEYFINKNGFIEGEFYHFYQNGKIKSKNNFDKFGIPNGLQQYWHHGNPNVGWAVNNKYRYDASSPHFLNTEDICDSSGIDTKYDWKILHVVKNYMGWDIVNFSQNIIEVNGVDSVDPQNFNETFNSILISSKSYNKKGLLEREMDIVRESNNTKVCRVRFFDKNGKEIDRQLSSLGYLKGKKYLSKRIESMNLKSQMDSIF
jgi:antitoxin component YwqK of YwqJK toxin-antitoxin module